MPTVPDHPGWDRGELGPGTWYAADGHTAEDLPLDITDGKFQDPIPWPILATGLSANVVVDYPDLRFNKPATDWDSWPAYARRRFRLRLPRSLAARQLILECFGDGRRHGLAYDADRTVRAFLPQVAARELQVDLEWLWLDMEGAAVYAAGRARKPEEAEA